ncbi:MAG: 54S ribosomal protein L3 [Paramarteilia canceri]
MFVFYLKSGKVLKGKKMPGQMGNRELWRLGLKIYRINYEHNILYIRGGKLPGTTGSLVVLRDSTIPGKCKMSLHPPVNDVKEEYEDNLYHFDEISNIEKFNNAFE